MRLQTMLHAVFPPECLNCSARVEDTFAICGSCWSDTPFILGASCDLCGTGLPGQSAPPDEALICAECQRVPRAWDHARAVFAYDGVGRRLVLSLKHGDRTDIARAAGPWMARAAADLLADDPVLVPVPLHWTRLARRRFNQAALLAWSLARECEAEVAPMALLRLRPTPSQEGRSRDARFKNVEEAIIPHPRKAQVLEGRNVLLIDDVMTSGATFAIATEACRQAGAKNVSVLTLARVGGDT
ncbi:ComF family protein [Gymnodinialimonas ceratoperidinii]|uniref:ComF family protein n=1 Tax=Gymnodinialimonas ceratoperidinii TaxID=2856823 RepID=A0A8F6YDD8_9RHOB|nr:ComF family protein [Gymnodinialimonas ceratoperidinii]QXT40087.1 ComF family protein [Gymnodinialimonas ceratoperidinii]